MRKFFNMNGMMVLGQGLVGKVSGLFTKGAKEATENLTKREATIFGDLVKQEAKRSGKTLDVVKKEMGEELAEQAKGMNSKLGTSLSGKLAQYGAAAVAVPTAATGVIGVVGSLDMAVNGKDSTASKAIENWMEGGKVADSLSDMKGLFSRIAEFFKLVVNGVQNFDKILKGDLSWMDDPKDTKKPNNPASNNDKDGMSPTVKADMTADSGNTPAALVTGLAATAGVTGAGLYAAKKLGGSVPSIVPSQGLFKNAFNAISHTTAGKLALGAGVVAGAVVGGATYALADENAQPAADTGNTPSAPEEKGYIEQGVDFANGLYNDASTENWTVGNAANLVNAGANGVAKGVGLVGSFAYANTVGWFTGQSTNEVQEQYVGKAIDSAFEATVGAPDLSGHWAQAVNFAGEMGLPAKAGLSLGIKAVNALNLAEKTGKVAWVLRNGVKNAPQFAIPTPGGQ